MADYDHGSISRGSQIWFVGDPKPFTVRAVSSDGRWVVCTRLFRGKVVCVVVDFEEELRDYVAYLDHATDEGCTRTLAMFESGEVAFSRCHPPISLTVTQVVPSENVPEDTTP
jgi:hypothetical protein